LVDISSQNQGPIEVERESTYTFTKSNKI